MEPLPIHPAVLITHLDYTAWATALILEAAGRLSEAELTRNLQSSHGSVLDTLRHIYYADRIWLARLTGEDPGNFRQPEPALSDLREIWPALLARFRDFISAVPNHQLAGDLDYKNLKGDRYAAARWKILLHVVNHATLHRGQVAGMLRQLGHQPPATDLIYFYLQAK